MEIHSKKLRLSYLIACFLISPLSVADRYGRVEVFDIGKVGEWHYEVNEVFAIANIKGSHELSFECENGCYFRVVIHYLISRSLISRLKNKCEKNQIVDVQIDMEVAKHRISGTCSIEHLTGIYISPDTSFSVLVPFNHDLFSDMKKSKTASISISDAKNGELILNTKFKIDGADTALPKVRDYGIHLGVFDDL